MAVTWVAGSTLAVVGNATSVSGTTPAGIADDDTLLAAVFGRSALTTPAGWTKLIETAVFTQGTINQRAAVFSKDTVTAADASTSLAWDQAASGRMGVTYAVLRGAGALAASNSNTVDSVDSWSITPPALTADGNGQMLVMFGSTINQSLTQTPTAPAGSTIFSGGAAADYRLAGAYQTRENAEANSGSFNMAPTGGATNNGLGSITLRFEPEEDPGVTGHVLADGPLGAALFLGFHNYSGWVSCPGPLGASFVLGFHDFTQQVEGLPQLYFMDLDTPTGSVSAGISSWQATLQVNGQNYVQCVIPACEPYLDAINAATAFTIYRTASLPDIEISYQMANAAINTAQLAQGPNRYTANLSGYSAAFAADAGLPDNLDRTLADVRSVFSEPSGLRVRCAVDWLLRPGMRAIHGAVTFDVGTINYYVSDGDQYMDVKEAEAG